MEFVFSPSGLGEDGKMLLQKPSEDAPLVQDRCFLNMLFLKGRDKAKVTWLVETCLFSSAEKNAKGRNIRKRLGSAQIKDLLTKCCRDYPRIAVFEDDVLTFRNIPEDRDGQVKLRNELMQAAGVNLKEFSAARML